MTTPEDTLPESHPASRKPKPAPMNPEEILGQPPYTEEEELMTAGKTQDPKKSEGDKKDPMHLIPHEAEAAVATTTTHPFSKDDLLALHDETCTKARAIMEQKNNDYTGGKGAADPFANFRMAEVIGLDPVMGLLLRMMDKIQRVRTFASDGELKVSGESVDDAFDDMVNYAILGKGMMRERRK